MRQRAAAAPQEDVSEQLLDREVLASHEQEQIVAELRATLLSQTRWWRSVFGVLGLALACGFGYFAASQAVSPWVGFRHHSQLKETLSAGSVAAAEAASAVMLAAPAVALLLWAPKGSASASASRRSRAAAPQVPAAAEQRLLYGSLAAAAVMAAFWLRAIWAAGRAGLLNPGQQLQLGWLPALPLAYVLLAVSVVRQYADTTQRLKALEGQMYQFEDA